MLLGSYRVQDAELASLQESPDAFKLYDTAVKYNHVSSETVPHLIIFQAGRQS